jgi:hypothetical protein
MAFFLLELLPLLLDRPGNHHPVEAYSAHETHSSHSLCHSLDLRLTLETYIYRPFFSTLDFSSFLPSYHDQASFTPLFMNRLTYFVRHRLMHSYSSSSVSASLLFISSTAS